MGVFGSNVNMYETTYSSKMIRQGKLFAYKDVKEKLNQGMDFIGFEKYLNKKIKELG